MFRKLGVAAVACAIVAGAVPTIAAAPNVPITGPAIATQGAVAVGRDDDMVSVSQTSFVTPDLSSRTASAAAASGAALVEGRGASVGMLAVWRGSAPLQQAAAGYQIPMSVTVLPVATVGAVMGRPISDVLGGGAIVMGATTAGLRGAQAGDSVVLVAADGSTRTFAIGLVADDATVGGTELLMSTAQADDLGVSEVTRLLLYGFADRRAVEGALAAEGVIDTASIGGQRTRVRRSWDPADPDSTIGMARTKQLLGEFAYRVLSDDSLALSPEWSAAHLAPEREWLFAYPGAPASSSATIRARCNLGVVADLTAALTDIHNAGLDAAIDFSNANTYGGCYNPRFNRVTGSVGFVSRHTWGMAFDTNTTTNAQGSTPQMNCDVVRIFRRHNFAWGGNFISRDGMHFEWVGERRDTLVYPSTYCPNTAAAVVLGGDSAVPSTPPGAQRAVMFADDGVGD
jgi:hypothetical protein